jgi:5-methylthioadenosine/S-adenosylhomocysteine deaminase
MAKELRLFPDVVLCGPNFAERRGVAVVVAGGAITEIADAETVRERGGDAEIVELPGQALMTGFVNAHQHGRGLTQFQLGFADDYLEIWMPGLRRAGILDPYHQTLLASLNMIAAGVVGVIHANTAYGSGDPATEMRQIMRAYADSGLRATVGLGLWDRAGAVYPDKQQAGFLDALPSALVERLKTRPRAFCSDPADAASTIRMLRAECDTDRVKAAYAPAGPQWVSDDLMAAALRDGANLGVAVHMHVAESRIQYFALRELYPRGLLARLEELGPVDARMSFGHAVWLGEADADLAAARGVTFVRNAGSNLRLHAGIAPLAAYRHHGVPIAIGTDSFSLAEDEDILKEVRLAGRLARPTPLAGPPAPTPVEMLRMLTYSGAKAGLFGKTSGVLEVGTPADLIAIDLARPHGAYVAPDTTVADLIYYRAEARDVRMTMVGGAILFRDGGFARHDIDLVTARAAEDAARAASRVTAEARTDIEAVCQHLSSHYERYCRERESSAAGWTALAESIGA